jgi:hypothetical protein
LKKNVRNNSPALRQQLPALTVRSRHKAHRASHQLRVGDKEPEQSTT